MFVGKLDLQIQTLSRAHIHSMYTCTYIHNQYEHMPYVVYEWQLENPVSMQSLERGICWTLLLQMVPRQSLFPNVISCRNDIDFSAVLTAHAGAHAHAHSEWCVQSLMYSGIIWNRWFFLMRKKRTSCSRKSLRSTNNSPLPQPSLSFLSALSQ